MTKPVGAVVPALFGGVAPGITITTDLGAGGRPSAAATSPALVGVPLVRDRPRRACRDEPVVRRSADADTGASDSFPVPLGEKAV